MLRLEASFVDSDSIGRLHAAVHESLGTCSTLSKCHKAAESAFEGALHISLALET